MPCQIGASAGPLAAQSAPAGQARAAPARPDPVNHWARSAIKKSSVEHLPTTPAPRRPVGYRAEITHTALVIHEVPWLTARACFPAVPALIRGLHLLFFTRKKSRPLRGFTPAATTTQPTINLTPTPTRTMKKGQKSEIENKLRGTPHYNTCNAT